MEVENAANYNFYSKFLEFCRNETRANLLFRDSSLKNLPN